MPALADGLHDVPPGKLATVVTYLEMTAPPAGGRPLGLPEGVAIAPVAAADPAWYRALFLRIGAPWLWFGRLAETDAILAATLGDPAHRLLKITCDGRDAGFAELDGRSAGEVEIVYFGLAPEATGRGLGHALMGAALDAAWATGVSRVWLHTCDLDDPRALPFYLRAGFSPYARRVEITDDPRLIGLLPPDAAPQVPLLGRAPAGT